MNDLIDSFANRLNKALTVRNMKPVELAEKTGIDKSKISSYMTGRYKAKQDGIHTISQALNVDPAWLMGYNVPMERTAPVSALFDFSTEHDRKLLNGAISYAIQNNIPNNEISTNSDMQYYFNNLEELDRNIAINFVQYISDKCSDVDDFNLDDYIASLRYNSEKKEEYTPKARAIARGFDKLSPDKQKIYTDLLKSMLDDEEF